MQRPAVATLILLAPIMAMLLVAGTAKAGTFSLWTCGSSTPGTTGEFVAQASAGFSTASVCPSNLYTPGMVLQRTGTAKNGASASWQATAPAGLSIVGATVPSNQLYAFDVNDGAGYGGGFYWQGGSSSINTGQASFSKTFNPAGWFGFQLVCNQNAGCSNSNTYQGEIAVEDIQLDVAENTGPRIVATGSNNLWYQPGWVRGSGWPISFVATDPSGVCSSRALVDGQSIAGPVSRRDSSSWMQCPDESMVQAIDTRSYPDGPMSLWLSSINGANVVTTDVRDSPHGDPVYVDNEPVTLGLSGPTDAPSTDGTQYIAASATAGPSGVNSISCSLDGAPPQSYPNPAASVPVQGIGVHHLTCTAFNNARDSSGAVASSAPVTWTLSIRQPSVSAVSFSRVVDALRCKATRERVHIPARWVTGRYHHRSVRIRLPPQTRTVRVVHCHPRLVRKRVRVDGRWYTERVIALPHTVHESTRHVHFGASTIVSGWLGTSQGTALGDQVVWIQAAADNGLNRFRRVAVATTAADGSWSALVPAGPSRILRAVYPGSGTVEPTISAPAQVISPASLSLKIHPSETHWGDTIEISGRLRGGYIPPAGELVVLRIGWSGGSTEIGHLYTTRGGRFRSSYTFLRGSGTQTYRLWAQTATESDYPFATHSSGKVRVKVTS